MPVFHLRLLPSAASNAILHALIFCVTVGADTFRSSGQADPLAHPPFPNMK